ncbi:unnamed protein product, partial [Discosporangium mesarthrocarpum]
MFRQGRGYRFRLETDGWAGPGAYNTQRPGDHIAIKDSGHMSPVFLEGREVGKARGQGRDVTSFPGHPISLGNGAPHTPGWVGKRAVIDRIFPNHDNFALSGPGEFAPMLDLHKTIAGDSRKTPMNYSACFRSVTERFENPSGPFLAVSKPTSPPWLGPGDFHCSRTATGHSGGGFEGGLRPVEAGDLVDSR